MSQITKALKKIEELRQDRPKDVKKLPATNAEGMETLFEETPLEHSGLPGMSDALKNYVMAWLAGLVMAVTLAISISAMVLTLKNSGSKQIQLSNLEKISNLDKTIASQLKRIDELTVLINKNKGLADNQTSALGLELSKESEARGVEAKGLASATAEHYDNLKNAVIGQKTEINFLNSYIKKLDQKLEDLSVNVAASKIQDNSTL